MENSPIHKIGVEIEGGWKNRLPNYHHDGSVDFVTRNIPLILKNKRKVSSIKNIKMRGEIFTAPTDSIEILKASIKINYPDIFNKTCGFHIHVSFKDLNIYALLMNKDFYDHFLSSMDCWAKIKLIDKLDRDLFFERFEGKNRYCWREFKPIEQLNGSFERYTQLNFSAFRKHGTLECRLFPVFKDYRKTISATITFLNTIHSYLKQAKVSQDTEKYVSLLKTANPFYIPPT